MASTPPPLTFAPFSSSFSPSFWEQLTSLKLHHLKLSDDPIPITASYVKGRSVKDRQTGEMVGLGCNLEFDAGSFSASVNRGETKVDDGQELNTNAASSSHRTVLHGILKNFNTIEDFRACDKTALLQSVADGVWKTINTESANEPVTGEKLNPFLVITFADLKKYKYWYWCGFPALLQKPGWEVKGEWGGMVDSLQDSEVDVLTKYHEESTASISLAKSDGQGGLAFGDLGSFEDFFAGTHTESRILVFSDPSSHPTAASWPLRNALYYLTHTSALAEIRVILLRDTVSQSRVVNVQLRAGISSLGKPSTVGWEKNEKGVLGARVSDLGPLMDPTRLADQAVDLNLQLMRWRIMPSLDLEKVSKTKVLLLGAGTLGCYVARTLMAWGVRKITLVDSSTVSFSNPVRQPLFEFEDSLGGGKPKAQAAAASLKRIYPGVDATGITLNIPMPGHPIAPALLEQTKEDVKTLEGLIEEHDVTYLLMDSRESRWLPTVIGASKRKLVMNVALGFDTFLVMRHGVSAAPGEKADESAPSQTHVAGAAYTGKLGCYYCNDIVAPMDSLTDRTLDQMCTVTRPGIASIASSTAVELMISILQHPKGSSAPSDIPLNTTNSSHTAPEVLSDPAASSPLGIVPHQIRGFLAQFNNLKITGQAYDRCTGCSPKIISTYEEQGFDMLVQAFEDAQYLERVTGLDELFKEGDELLESVDWDEEDDEAQME